MRPELRERARALRRQMTPAEQRFWNVMRGERFRGLRFRRQQVIGPFIVDFYCPALQLAVELDGAIHDAQAERDAEREAFLQNRGIRVLRFRNEEVVDNLRSVVERLLAIAQASPSPPRPSPFMERGRG